MKIIWYIYSTTNYITGRPALCLVLFFFAWLPLSEAKVYERVNFNDAPLEFNLPDLEGSLEVGEKKVYNHPEGERGFYHHGLEPMHDGAINGRNYAGIAFEIVLPANRSFVGKIKTQTPGDVSQDDIYARNSAAFSVAGEGVHRVFLRWEDFNRDEALDAWVKFIKTISITGNFSNDTNGSVKVRNPRLVKGEVLAISSNKLGTAAEAGKKAVYELTLLNCRKNEISITASPVADGWEEMSANIEPSTVMLPPESYKTVRAKVEVSERIPEGAFEVQKIRFVPNGNTEAAETVKLYTSRLLDEPSLVHDKKGWNEVRAKTDKYEWAAEKRDRRIKDARDWDVPPTNSSGEVYGGDVAGSAFNTAVAWQLSRDKELAEKVALFLRRFCDPETGYPAMQNVTYFGFFANTAKAYDLIKDADVLSAGDVEKIKKTFRLYEEVMRNRLSRGDMGNHQVSMAYGGLYAALAIDDMAMAHRFIHGPGKLMDQFSAGFMSDGWWFESDVGYGTGMVKQFLSMAVSLEPRGIDWINKGFPINYSQPVSITPDRRRDLSEFAEMDYRKYGPITRTTLTLEEICQGILPFMDYRGVAFGTNDSQANQMGAGVFELAYHVYRSPEFLAVLNRLNSRERNLLYGVPDLPESPDDMTPAYEKSFHSDNIGYAVLRSQNDRPVEERIQAALKYGTHGGHHGHYDRGNLVCLMRYGRNMGIPKGEWFSYVPVFYKCFNQMSTQHNMVVVDQKNQEPVESEQLLFHSGESFQASAMETHARWSFIPARNQGEEKLEGLWRYIPPYPGAPENPDKMLGYTEPVRQRRLLLVTDDYVVLADNLQGKQEHDYDHSLWIRGLRDMTAQNKDFDRRDSQLDPDPRKAAQLITNVDWYDVEGTLKTTYSYEIEPGSRDETYYHNSPGPMNYNVFHAWPDTSRSAALCELPNSSQQKKLWWHATDGEGQKLAEGYTQPWVIGKGEVDLNVEGLGEVVLSTKLKYKSGDNKKDLMSLFWHGEVITAGGETIPLSEVPYTTENMARSGSIEEDYFGGAIDLAGKPVKEALPAEPANNKEPGLIKLDLEGLDAVRLKGVVASDHPLGNKPERRRGLIVRQTGKTARFLTVIEPFGKQGVVQSVNAENSGTLKVHLTDGRTHTFNISGLDDPEGDIKVTMIKEQNGRTVGTESTSTPEE